MSFGDISSQTVSLLRICNSNRFPARITSKDHGDRLLNPLFCPYRIGRDSVVYGMTGLTYDTPNGPLSLDPLANHTTLRMFLAEGGDDFRVVRQAGNT